MMKILGVGCVVIFCHPMAAVSQIAIVGCDMTLECLEQEACAETSFGITVLQDADIPTRYLIETGSETLEATALLEGTRGHLLATTGTAAHLLSIYPDLDARYSVHLAGPYSITYHGQCEAPA